MEYWLFEDVPAIAALLALATMCGLFAYEVRMAVKRSVRLTVAQQMDRFDRFGIVLHFGSVASGVAITGAAIYFNFWAWALLIWVVFGLVGSFTSRQVIPIIWQKMDDDAGLLFCERCAYAVKIVATCIVGWLLLEHT